MVSSLGQYVLDVGQVLPPAENSNGLPRSTRWNAVVHQRSSAAMLSSGMIGVSSTASVTRQLLQASFNCTFEGQHTVVHEYHAFSNYGTARPSDDIEASSPTDIEVDRVLLLEDMSDPRSISRERFYDVARALERRGHSGAPVPACFKQEWPRSVDDQGCRDHRHRLSVSGATLTRYDNAGSGIARAVKYGRLGIVRAVRTEEWTMWEGKAKADIGVALSLEATGSSQNGNHTRSQTPVRWLPHCVKQSVKKLGS
ncbi:hypothetical protein HETIRDRAFT_424692 [Heterobasidion irregulare TC 32-1]|uniref:Uncharacterized protein n=1 Tax=Heterobasidion irregulare (strain TC 32-1) TaxID=747525 RepID=W4KK12_HETIT|nr:uncharacterized protein HETIRDRAFT_424692 [Heterobasidion irregulare TC 32-1]ETW85376.1 hypothetical protein HETIRDRAFT_424692 [Heterobasidion irregulare TC 32-1]